MLPRPPLLPLQTLLLPLLQQRLAAPLAQGELAFLEGRSIALKLRELPWTAQLGLHEGKFWLSWDQGTAQASMEGELSAILQLATAKADGDALFFQRKLSVGGDTELAMEIKSLLGRHPLLPKLPALPAPSVLLAKITSGRRLVRHAH